MYITGVRNGPDITVPTTTTTTTTTTRRPPQTTTQEPSGGYDKCKDGKLDAITMGTDGEAYAFRGIHLRNIILHILVIYNINQDDLACLMCKYVHV